MFELTGICQRCSTLLKDAQTAVGLRFGVNILNGPLSPLRAHKCFEKTMKITIYYSLINIINIKTTNIFNIRSLQSANLFSLLLRMDNLQVSSSKCK